MKHWLFAFIIAFFINGIMTEEARSDAFVITMEYWSPYYQPSKAVIQHGNKLQVVNNTSSIHTIRHDECLNSTQCLFDTGIVRPNGKISFPDLPPGEYTYHCELHPIMRGTIIVERHVEPDLKRGK